MEDAPGIEVEGRKKLEQDTQAHDPEFARGKM
jgi:hypothetical protein